MSAAEALLASLPDHLRERTWQRNGDQPTDGEFVLCWLHHALRADGNPVLDAAITAAAALDLPLLVYQGLGGRHRFNSDRHHRFILEAAVDLDAGLRERGHRLRFHLPRDPAGPGPFPKLTTRAALVVTELYPVPPFSQWYRAGHRRGHTPWWFVDAACVVPMTLSPRRLDRAFEFRRAWQSEYDARVGVAWPGCDARAVDFDGEPGFEPFDLGSDLGEAIAGCAIDHAIGPVAHTPGGSKSARRRWDTFRAKGLGGYANRRNDAAEAWPRGVSRLSPYLHYGCIAPWAVASEAAAASGKGPEKFLDELLVWRELAHHFCFRTPDPETLDALPAWAVETLGAHRADDRPRLDWETLARGRTGDPLWDLAQQSLLRHGELHNNVRMTWGKALPAWSAGPEEALERLIDLNHRYALDGNDPCSYGGLLWCLGQFDRPFRPEVPVLGTVRPRSSEAHARRLDLDAYGARVMPPAGGAALNIVVIGAGVSGLTAARILQDHGHRVRVLDKGRGPGGRASTRRSGSLRFDHGAQYFTARDERFRRHVEAWVEQGVVAPWEGAIGVYEDGAERPTGEGTERFVGVPGMSAVCAHLAEDLAVDYGWQVDAVRTLDGRPCIITSGQEPLTADSVLLSTPPVQAGALLENADVALPPMPSLEPCWAVMATFDRRPIGGWEGAFVNDGPLAWIARQAGRPGRPGDEAWVLHASEAWTRDHLEESREFVRDELLAALAALPGATGGTVIDAMAHRWRYARAEDPEHIGSLWFEEARIGLCGDWLNGSRIEGAFLSGAALAGRVLGSRLVLGR